MGKKKRGSRNRNQEKSDCEGVCPFLFFPGTNRAVHPTNNESAKGQMEMAGSWRIIKTDLNEGKLQRRYLSGKAAEGSIKGDPLRC